MITCHQNITNGTFYLGDIQFQTVFDKDHTSTQIKDKNQTSWEKICQDLNMQLINETHALAITTERQNEDIWRLIGGYSYFWLTNKTPKRYG